MAARFYALAALLLAGCQASSPSDEDTTTSDPNEPASVELLAVSEPCAVGTQTRFGCEVTYLIDAATLHLPAACEDSATVYNDCSGEPLAFTWKDAGQTAPKAVRIELGISLFCASSLVDSSFPQRQDVSMNDGASFGGFDGDLTACTCSAPTTAHTFDMSAAALASYHAGAKNTLHVNGKNLCIGVGPLDSGAVAHVIVTY